MAQAQRAAWDASLGKKSWKNLEENLMGVFGGFSRARISFLLETGAKALQPPRALQ